MNFDLAQMWRRASNPRRKSVTFRPIVPPGTMATDLYQSSYAPVLAMWGEAVPRIMDAYARALSSLTTDSPEEVGGILEGLDGELARLVLTLRLRLERWTLNVEKWQRGKWRGAVLSATGVEIGTLVGPADVRETLGAAVERNVALIRSVSDQARGRIADSVFRGLNERRAATEVAKEIREAVEMGRARARRIASDQLVKVSSTLADERRREAGIDKWKWRHSGKLHPRAEHVARNGKIYSDDSPPADMPGQKPFCGCTQQAVLGVD